MADHPLPIPVSIRTQFQVAVTPRKYQLELANPGLLGENYICVAPTGTGKTLVAALVIADHLQKNKHKKNCHVMFIVNTKPLADQQTKKMKEYIPNVKVETYTGDVETRVADSFKENNISVCTAGKLLDELRKGLVDFSKFSLMVFDECHHTRKSHPYAELMKMYLEKRMDDDEPCNPVQIIGMTASPGAGENLTMEVSKTIDHLVKLMALLDAKGGIKMVRENTQELQECMKSSTFTRKIMKPRDPAKDPFIIETTRVMKMIEDHLGLSDIKSCTYEKWTQRYETSVQQVLQPLEMSSKKEYRDYISGLKLLKGFCTALSIYMDLRAADAIREIEELSEIIEDAKATPKEKERKRMTTILLDCLKSLPVIENPMLSGIKTIFEKQFSEAGSHAIVFVRTKKHTKGMQEWISQEPDLKRLGARPGILTGHTSERGSGMTKAEQEDAMEKFHRGEVNVLIATSVAEEGLDVPACNTVIRYQHVSDEIAKVQTEGRARAEGSCGYTILSSTSGKKHQEVRNEGLVLLVNEILEEQYLPTGKILEEQIIQLQKEIIEEKQWKRRFKRHQLSCEAKKVRLLCKACKVLACYGSDISTVGDEENFHYVVHEKQFRERYTIKEHKKPCFLIPTIFKVHKIHCAKCDADWGVECFWPRGHAHPVIKCKSFAFEINGITRPVKKWSSAPFKCEPFTSKFQLDSDNSDED